VLGSNEGSAVGLEDRVLLGISDGIEEGNKLGCLDFVGSFEGKRDGKKVGKELGALLDVGEDEGKKVGI